MRGLVIDGCAGPGGWSQGLRGLGIHDVGLELDAAACATRRAAGHRTIRADVSQFPVERLAGKVWGHCDSPPCTTFSGAGKRGGVVVMEILSGGIQDAFAGRKTRALTRREMARTLRSTWWPSPKLTRAERSARIWTAVRSASLVIEPARFITVSRPEWVALEQVPSVLPLWQVYASELRKLGYSTWCGKLNSADYGVPQTRERAILIASRARKVYRPEPTHYDPRKGMQLWGTPWVSMAEALGWGATGRPVPTVTAGGVAHGGYEPFAKGGRECLTREQAAGQWALRKDAQRNAALRPAPAPAPTISFGHAASSMRWVLHRSRGASVDRRDHPADEPAPTITGAGGKVGTNLTWVKERPATTLQCDERIFPPHAGSKGEHQSTDSIRITVQEAAVLQSFPADYPWQGSKTKQYEQVGNAVPPLLAMHVVAEATGLAIAEAAA